MGNESSDSFEWIFNAFPDHPLKKNEILDVGDITICVSRPGGAGLRKEDSSERSPSLDLSLILSASTTKRTGHWQRYYPK